MNDKTREAVENILATVLIMFLIAIPPGAAWWWAINGMASEVGMAWLITWIVVLVVFVAFASAVDEADKRRDRDRNGWRP